MYIFMCILGSGTLRGLNMGERAGIVISVPIISLRRKTR